MKLETFKEYTGLREPLFWHILCSFSEINQKQSLQGVE